MKTSIICKQSVTGHGVVFECGNCAKSLFVNSLCKRKECLRCGKKFRNKIIIERVEV